jgi:hypothetical protein
MARVPGVRTHDALGPAWRTTAHRIAAIFP